jgi:hypothetical protein
MAQITNWHTRLPGQAAKFDGEVRLAADLGERPCAAIRVRQNGWSGKSLLVYLRDPEEIAWFVRDLRELDRRLVNAGLVVGRRVPIPKED